MGKVPWSHLIYTSYKYNSVFKASAFLFLAHLILSILAHAKIQWYFLIFKWPWKAKEDVTVKFLVLVWVKENENAGLSTQLASTGNKWMQSFSRDKAVSRQRQAVLQCCTSMSDTLQIKCKSTCLLGSKPRQDRNPALYRKHTTLLVCISQMLVISSRDYQVKD